MTDTTGRPSGDATTAHACSTGDAAEPELVDRAIAAALSEARRARERRRRSDALLARLAERLALIQADEP